MGIASAGDVGHGGIATADRHRTSGVNSMRRRAAAEESPRFGYRIRGRGFYAWEEDRHQALAWGRELAGEPPATSLDAGDPERLAVVRHHESEPLE